MNFHLSRPSLLGQLLSVQSDSSRDQNRVPSMASFPRVTSQLPSDRFNTLEPFHHGRVSVLSLMEEILSLDGDLPSQQAVLLPTYYLWTKHYLSCCHGFLQSIAFNKETQFTKMNCGNVPVLMKFTVLTMFPTILIEARNGLLKS